MAADKTEDLKKLLPIIKKTMEKVGLYKGEEEEFFAVFMF